MNLPELDWQIIYGRLSWAMVMACLLTAVGSRSRPLSRPTLAFLLFGTAAIFALPDEGSPAYWLSLAFQWPSGTLVGLCLAKLYFAWRGKRERPAMPLSLAAAIALVGALLYIEVAGWISFGLYYWGFDAYAPPALALALSVGCLFSVARGVGQPQAFSLLLAVGIFALWRLPTGNVWDALLDPLLWSWAIISLATGLASRAARRHASAQP